MTMLYEALCGEAFSTQQDATSHEWHCDQCAGVLDSIEKMLESENVQNLETELAPVYDAALPKDAPGAWIRAAIERMYTQPTLPGLG